MKKSFAWTLAEMVIAIVVITVLTGACLSIFKPKTQNSKLFVFATVRNLMRANNVILQDNEKNLSNKATAAEEYCLKLVDAFTTKSSGCNSTTGKYYIEFVNGVRIDFDSTQWVTTDNYQYLDFTIDIDGSSKGHGKTWVDKYPMTVFSGPGYDGVVFPRDCSKSILTGHASCPGNDTTNYLEDNTIISFDVFRSSEFDEDGTQAMATNLISATLSPMEADCAAYGGRGFFTNQQCYSAGYKLNEKCANEETCHQCADSDKASGQTKYNICPSGKTKAQCNTLAHGDKNVDGDGTNDDDLPCYTLIHKPNAGMSFIVESVIGEIDTEY